MTALPQMVVCQVPFRRRLRQRGKTSASPVEAAPKVPAGQVPRIARLMALALRFEQLLWARSGITRSWPGSGMSAGHEFPKSRGCFR